MRVRVRVRVRSAIRALVPRGTNHTGGVGCGREAWLGLGLQLGIGIGHTA